MQIIKLNAFKERCIQIFKNEYFWLFVVFSLFCLTRFYNLDQRIIFGWDQEQISTQIRDIVINHKFTLLGPRVNNDLGFFLASYLTYLLVPLYIISNLYPGVLLWFVVLINILFYFSSFFIIKRVFSSTHAIWFLAFWTINSRLQLYDSIPWWPILIPLGVILTLYILFHIKRSPQKLRHFVYLGLAEGFFMNMHFQFIFVILFSVVFIFLLYKKKRFPIINFFAYCLCFIVIFTPLLLFDLRHNLLNTKLFFAFFSPQNTILNKDYFSWIAVLSNFLDSFTYWSFSLFVIIFLLGLFYIHISQRKQKKGFLQLFYCSSMLMAICTILFFSYYGKRPSEYYFIFLAPFVYLSVLNFLLHKNNKKIIPMIFVFLLLVNSSRIMNNVQPNYGGLYYKDQVVKYIKQSVEKEPFNISYDGVSVDHGFKYLLDYYDINPSYLDAPLIQVRIPAKKGDITFGLYGIKLPSELK